MSFLTNLFTRLANRSSAPPRTIIHTAEFDGSYVDDHEQELTIRTIRATEGDSWQPPAPARRDPRRPRSDRW
jgi:hypothetical protein